MTMLFYTWVVTDFGQKWLEGAFKRYFWAVVLALLFVELVVTIWPTANVRGSAVGQFCYRVDDSYATERRTGWLYLVMFPYFIPLFICLYPAVMLGLRLRQSRQTPTEVKITLAVVAGFFFFHLLYYALMLGRELEALLLERSEWRRLLGLHVWYITRPMFALIGYGWNIMVPLAPFCFDDHFARHFPGTWINRRRLRAKEAVGGSKTSVSATEDTTDAIAASARQDNGNDRRFTFENPMQDLEMIETSEFNQSVV